MDTAIRINFTRRNMAAERQLYQTAIRHGLDTWFEQRLLEPGDPTSSAFQFVASGSSPSAVGEVSAEIRRAHPDCVIQREKSPPLRPMAGMSADGLVLADFRHEIESLICALDYGQTDMLGDDRWIRTLHIRKVRQFTSDVRNILGGHFGDVSSISAVLAVDGGMNVGIDVSRPAKNDNSIPEIVARDEDETVKRIGRAYVQLDLYLDALDPVLRAFDANPRDANAIGRACRTVLATTTELENLRFSGRLLPMVLPTRKQLQEGMVRGLGLERQWVFEAKRLVSEGRLREALDLISGLPHTSMARGRRNSWFEGTDERMALVIEHLCTMKPTWNQDYRLWCRMVEERGSGPSYGVKMEDLAVTEEFRRACPDVRVPEMQEVAQALVI